jgi:hypothetical protein
LENFGEARSRKKPIIAKKTREAVFNVLVRIIEALVSL